MPTKDELTEQLSVANVRIAELEEATEQLSVANARIAELEETTESGGETVTDTEGEILLEGSLYYMSDAGLTSVPAYAAEGKAVTLTEDGQYHDVELPDPDALSDCDRMKAAVGAEVFDAAVLVVLEEAGEGVNSADDLTDAEMADAVLHVLMRPGTTSDAEEGEESGTMAMLRADLQRVTIERDDARNQRDLAQKRLNDAGTLHGSIDSLPSQV